MIVGEGTPKMSIDYKKCTGCRICEQICTFSHEREFNPRRARIKVLVREKEGINAPLLCIQCKKCLSSCHRDALSWDEKIGVVRVDAQKCNGCGLCMEACDQSAIFLDPISGVVNLCDLCNGDPQCVKWCEPKVLTYRAASAA
jgi:carbon-monoxide dehydrogenase iron sulfur subunit